MGDTAVQVDLPGLGSLDEGLLGLVAELGGEDRVDLCVILLVMSSGSGFGFVRIKALIMGLDNVPAAAIEKGPLITPSSSWVTKEG